MENGIGKNKGETTMKLCECGHGIMEHSRRGPKPCIVNSNTAIFDNSSYFCQCSQYKEKQEELLEAVAK